MDKLALKDVLARMIAHRAEQSSADIQKTKVTEAQGGTVLVVDDSRTIVRALQRMLEDNGFQTHAGFDGEQAIAMTRRFQPDAILMDIVMPNMNGFEATRILVNDPQTAGIPIVIVSGSEQPADRVWGLRLGAKGFLTKPINREELITKLRSVIAVARRAREHLNPLLPADPSTLRR